METKGNKRVSKAQLPSSVRKFGEVQHDFGKVEPISEKLLLTTEKLFRNIISDEE